MTGARKDGIPGMGFITIGIPKMIGSLMLKIPQGIARRAIALKSSLLENSRMAIIRPPVIPEPVCEKNAEPNGVQMMFGMDSPATYAALLAA